MALKVAMHNWMRPEPIETTIARLGRSGYDGIEISGEPAVYDADHVKGLLAQHDLECWGAVTLMTGGRDLVHEDYYVRMASVEYVKDCLSLVASLGGKILTVVPSTVGKVVPMGTPEDEWRWCVEGLKRCQEKAEEVGVRIGVEPLNRFETYFVNRADQAVAMAEAVGGNCGVALDIFHMNMEEADWAQAIRDTGDRLVDFHVADNNRMPPGPGRDRLGEAGPGARRRRLRRLPHRRVRRHGRPLAAVPAHGDRRRLRGRREPGDGAVPARPRNRRPARALLRRVRAGLDRPVAPGARDASRPPRRRRPTPCRRRAVRTRHRARRDPRHEGAGDRLRARPAARTGDPADRRRLGDPGHARLPRRRHPGGGGARRRPRPGRTSRRRARAARR